MRASFSFLWSILRAKIDAYMVRNLRLPGSMIVSGKQITDLKVLGNAATPGITKARRLSLRGLYNGRPVKIYSAFSPAQVALRLDIQKVHLSSVAFPEVIAADDCLIVEAWIDGDSIHALSSAQREAAQVSVRIFLEECQQSETLLALAREHTQSFCYFHDYLLARLRLWRHLQPVDKVLMAWQQAYALLSPALPQYLSHPDLSAANLIREKGTGKLYVVDNELLGVGHGWVLDRLNSCLAESDISMLPQQDVPGGFVELSWRLRKLGSAFDAYDFSRVEQLLRA